MDNFILSLRFHPNGNVDGSFLFHTDKEDKVSDIKYGLFLNREGKISFTFSVDWWMKEGSSVSTYFSGYLLNEDHEEYLQVDWLMVIEGWATKDRYTKKGQFSIEGGNKKNSRFPFPSNNIRKMFCDKDRVVGRKSD